MSLTHYVHLSDPPLVLHDGEVLRGRRFVLGGASYGRMLFTRPTAIEIHGSQVRVEDCVFEVPAQAKAGSGLLAWWHALRVRLRTRGRR